MEYNSDKEKQQMKGNTNKPVDFMTTGYWRVVLAMKQAW